MKGLTNTQRTLRALREQGCIAEIVERYVKFGATGFGCRKDLFGFLDIISLDPKKGIVGIQSTSGGCLPEHRRKIFEDKSIELQEWLKAGGKVEIYAWRKIKLKRGGKAERWSARIEEITTDSLNNYRSRLIADDIDRSVETEVLDEVETGKATSTAEKAKSKAPAFSI